jgi:hypothetical protein
MLDAKPAPAPRKPQRSTRVGQSLLELQLANTCMLEDFGAPQF